MQGSIVYRVRSVLFFQCDRLVDFKAVISQSKCHCLWNILCKNKCSDPSKYPTLNILYFPLARRIVIHPVQLKNYGRC